VIGSSVVTIIEGREIVHNNIAGIKDSAPLSVGKIGVYLLSQADEFDLRTRTFTPVVVAEHEQEA
jgi:cyanophycinase-like exopeptidase